MYRRPLCLGLLAFASAQVACRQRANQTLRISALKETVPPQVIKTFRETLSTPIQLQLETLRHVSDLFQQLQHWQNNEKNARKGLFANPFNRANAATTSDWVGLGDYWLQTAINQGLICRLATDASPPWAKGLPDAWRSLLQRNGQGALSATGSLWATPYRWGCLTMVYSRQHFGALGWQPSRWQDIWASELEGRVSLPNHPHIALGIVLKSLGYSGNDSNPKGHSDVVEALDALSKQVKVYTSSNFIQPLIQGDTWLAVGWSTDIRPVLSQYGQLRAVVPNPGTLLTADVWVSPNPKSSHGEEAPIATIDELDEAWLSHWWQESTATPLSLFSKGLSPFLIEPDIELQALGLAGDDLLMPTSTQLNQSEFLEPLSSETQKEYIELWEKLRGLE